MIQRASGKTEGRGSETSGSRGYHKMRYSLVVILELNSGSEVQYKKIMIIGDE